MCDFVSELATAPCRDSLRNPVTLSVFSHMWPHLKDTWREQTRATLYGGLVKQWVVEQERHLVGSQFASLYEPLILRLTQGWSSLEHSFMMFASAIARLLFDAGQQQGQVPASDHRQQEHKCVTTTWLDCEQWLADRSRELYGQRQQQLSERKEFSLLSESEFVNLVVSDFFSRSTFTAPMWWQSGNIRFMHKSMMEELWSMGLLLLLLSHGNSSSSSSSSSLPMDITQLLPSQQPLTNDRGWLDAVARQWSCLSAQQQKTAKRALWDVVNNSRTNSNMAISAGNALTILN